MRGILAETRENVPETSQFHVSVNVIGCNYCGNTSLHFIFTPVLIDINLANIESC